MMLFPLQDILETLQFVHQQKVIHRDVNPYLRSRRQGLIDFGAVKQITQVAHSPGKKFTVAIGTPGYVPVNKPTATLS